MGVKNLEIIFLIIAKTLSVWLTAVSYAMLARMLLPLFVDAQSSRLYTAAYFISEPAVIPVRAVMKKMDVGQSSPLDIPFTVTYFIILIIKLFLP